MNEDPSVCVANIAEMFLGSIKMYNDIESIPNHANVKEIETMIKELGKDEYYEIIKNCLIRMYGTNLGDFAGEAMNAELVLESLASNSDSIIDEILKKVPESVGKTILDKGEDLALDYLAPYLYFVKHGIQTMYDGRSIYDLMDAYNECMINGANYKYVSYIITPQKAKNTPSVESRGVLTSKKRSVVTTESCDLRGIPSQNYQHFMIIPENTELELVGSMTGDDGELYYEVIYNGTRGYIPADEAVVK